MREHFSATGVFGQQNKSICSGIQFEAFFDKSKSFITTDHRFIIHKKAKKIIKP